MKGTLACALAFVTACSSPKQHGDLPDANAKPPDAAIDGPPTAVPIKHVVVVVKENHTFDNYFGSFPGADGISQIQTASGTISPPVAPDSTSRDLCHMHSCALTDWSGGTMNGWDQVSGTSINGDNLAYAQYGEAQI